MLASRVMCHAFGIRLNVFLLLLLCIINNIKAIIIYLDVFNDMLYARADGHCRAVASSKCCGRRRRRFCLFGILFNFFRMCGLARFIDVRLNYSTKDMRKRVRARAFAYITLHYRNPI